MSRARSIRVARVLSARVRIRYRVCTAASSSNSDCGQLPVVCHEEGSHLIDGFLENLTFVSLARAHVRAGDQLGKLIDEEVLLRPSSFLVKALVTATQVKAQMKISIICIYRPALTHHRTSLSSLPRISSGIVPRGKTRHHRANLH